VLIIGEDFLTCQQESENICMLHERLRKEREKNGLIQQAVADIVGVSKRTVIDWEKGVSSPTAVQLSALFEKGFDVYYITTGERLHLKDYPIGGMSTPLFARQELLSEREHALLDDFRSLSDKEKDAAETMLHAAAQQKVKKA
jgi:transcriptional regulator with XRE-family HTH domain